MSRSAGRSGTARIPLVDQVFQFLARFEEWNLFGGNFDAITCLWITPDAGVALAGAKTAKASNLDLVACAQRMDDAVEDGFHDDFAVPTGDVGNSGNFFDQVGFRHKLYIPPEMRHSVKC